MLAKISIAALHARCGSALSSMLTALCSWEGLGVALACLVGMGAALWVFGGGATRAWEAAGSLIQGAWMAAGSHIHGVWIFAGSLIATCLNILHFLGGLLAAVCLFALAPIALDSPIQCGAWMLVFFCLFPAKVGFCVYWMIGCCSLVAQLLAGVVWGCCGLVIILLCWLVGDGSWVGFLLLLGAALFSITRK